VHVFPSRLGLHERELAHGAAGLLSSVGSRQAGHRRRSGEILLHTRRNIFIYPRVNYEKMQYGDSSDDEILLDVWHMENQVLIASATAVAGGLSASDETGNESVNTRESLRDVLTTLSSSPSIFRKITNFEVVEFNILCRLVCPVVECTARSIGNLRVCCGRPSKISSQQRALNALMYLKHDNTV
jgi:hypothetical protein